MKKLLNWKTKEDFYIKLYFNTADGFRVAGVKRAYLDFNRTLKIKDKNQKKRDLKRFKTESFLIKQLDLLISKSIHSQDNFDLLHKELCFKLIQEWKELSIGQAQKWINMTLKYWLLFGEERIENIEKNAFFFHIPIDSYVQKHMFKETNPKPWSKILDYQIYMDYQIEHRNKETGNPAIIDEFIFFSNI